MYCSKCGSELSNDAKFCKSCGVKILPEAEIAETQTISSCDVKTDIQPPSVEISSVVDPKTGNVNGKWAAMFALFPSIEWALLSPVMPFLMVCLLVFVIYLVCWIWDAQTLKKYDEMYGTQYYGGWVAWGVISPVYIIIRGCKTKDYSPVWCLIGGYIVSVLIGILVA